MPNSEDQELDQFLDRAVARFRDARGDHTKIRQAIDAYLSEGDRKEMSPHELRDYFDISSPGLAELAGYSAAEQAEAVHLYEAVSGERYGGI